MEKNSKKLKNEKIIKRSLNLRTKVIQSTSLNDKDLNIINFQRYMYPKTN